MERVMPDSSPAKWKTPASNWKISPCSSRHFQAKSGTAYQLCLVLSGGAGLPPGGTTYQHHLGVPWPGHSGLAAVAFLFRVSNGHPKRVGPVTTLTVLCSLTSRDSKRAPPSVPPLSGARGLAPRTYGRRPSLSLADWFQRPCVRRKNSGCRPHLSGCTRS